MICVDNSEWMRNGDLVPTRLQCQQEAVNLVMQCKLRANPESGVGLLSMADQVEVLSTMTREERKLFIKLHEVQIKGNAQLINAIKVAHLALRHRQNRAQKMRIVMFVGSPIEGIDKAEFTKLAKKLKKEKINVDFICFGEAISEENQLLSEFVDTLNGKDNQTSNILVVSGGSKLIEALVTSPICQGEGGNMMIGANGEFENEEDPELMLALRVSLEEQRQRQRLEAEQNGGEPADNAMEVQPSEQSTAGAANTSTKQPSEVDLSAMTEEEQLEWALRMSMADGAEEEKPREGGATSSASQPESMELDANVGELINNPELLQQLVEGIPEEGKDDKKDTKKPDDSGKR